MCYYIQIGAGAGDLDHAAGFRDGFSKFVKEIDLGSKDFVLVVEANPFNIPVLSRSWNGFSQVKVLQLAISNNFTPVGASIEFYYSKDDGPFFQVSSVYKYHVEKFYPESEIIEISVPCLDINSFLKTYVQNGSIELLALDIEGMDLLVIQELDLTQFKIHKISFERSHGQGLNRIVNAKLRSAGYKRAGMGMDPHNSDVLWVKPKNGLESISIFYSHFKHALWEIQIPIRHSLKMKFLSN